MAKFLVACSQLGIRWSFSQLLLTRKHWIIEPMDAKFKGPYSNALKVRFDKVWLEKQDK